MNEILFLIEDVTDSSDIKDHINKGFDDNLIIDTEKKLLGNYKVSDYPELNSKSLQPLLCKLFDRFNVKNILRIRTDNIPVPKNLLVKFYNYYRSNELIYSRVDTKGISINGVILELFSRECIDTLYNSNPFTVLDGGLNAYGLKKTMPYWMPLEELNFYLIDNYDVFYSLPASVSIEVTSQCNL